MIECSKTRPAMASYQRSDYIKVEVVNERTGETEWLWS
jgi:hypothetical protein